MTLEEQNHFARRLETVIDLIKRNAPNAASVELRKVQRELEDNLNGIGQ